MTFMRTGTVILLFHVFVFSHHHKVHVVIRSEPFKSSVALNPFYLSYLAQANHISLPPVGPVGSRTMLPTGAWDSTRHCGLLVCIRLNCLRQLALERNWEKPSVSLFPCFLIKKMLSSSDKSETHFTSLRWTVLIPLWENSHVVNFLWCLPVFVVTKSRKEATVPKKNADWFDHIPTDWNETEGFEDGCAWYQAKNNVAS